MQSMMIYEQSLRASRQKLISSRGVSKESPSLHLQHLRKMALWVGRKHIKLLLKHHVLAAARGRIPDNKVQRFNPVRQFLCFFTITFRILVGRRNSWSIGY